MSPQIIIIKTEMIPKGKLRLRKSDILRIVFFIFFYLLLFLFPRIVFAANLSGSADFHNNIYRFSAQKYTVKSIKYVLPRNIPLKVVKNFIYIKADKKFSMYFLEKTLKSLYSTVYFSNILVNSKINRRKKLIYLKFIFYPRILIGDVLVYLPKNMGTTKQRILNAIPLKKGGQFLKYYKKNSLEIIKKIMSEIGYPDAKIDFSYYTLRNTKKYIVKIRIKLGSPVIISNIFVKSGIYGFRKTVLGYAKKIEGKPLNKYSIQKLRRKIWDLYKNNGYLNAIITKPKITHISKYKAVVSYEVHPGYKIIFNFKGISPLKPGFIETSVFGIKNVLIFDNFTFDSFKKILRDFFKQRGYYFARIYLKEEKNRRSRTIKLYYKVVKGFKVAVKSIEIKGNGPFKIPTIMSLMKTKETSFFNHEYFCKKRLINDTANINNYYNNAGYLNARILYKFIFSPDKKSVSILLNINRGIRTYVKDILVSGLPVLIEKKLSVYFQAMRAKPLYIIKAQNIKELISTELANSGYVFSKTRLNIKYSKDKHYAYLHYIVQSGPQVRIRNIYIMGNTITKSSYIKSLLLFKKGEIYDQKKIIDTENRLYKAGIFNSVNIGIKNTNGIKPYKDIVVKVKDAKPFSVSFGPGYGTYTKYKGFIQIEDSNLFGSGKSLSMRFSKSAIYTNLLLDYYDRAIFNYRGLAFNAQGLDTDIITLNYTLHKEGGTFSLIRRFNNRLKGLLSYEMYYDFLSGLNPGAQITPRDIGFTRISSASASLIYNTKNNMFNPVSGNLTALRFTYSSALLDSQINFFKIFFHTEEFIPFVYNTVFLYSVRFGYIRPLPPTTQVPINERFFLGGRTTVRGFPQDSIGLINLNPYSYPIGGDVMENYNLQLNIPVHKNINFFIFQDGGNVFLNARDIRPFALYKSAGAGIMFLSPIGPVSFSYGFLLTREPYWPAGGVNFTIGTSF